MALTSVGLCKIFALILAIATVAITIVARPDQLYKDTFAQHNIISISLWKENSFFVITIFGLFYAIISLIAQVNSNPKISEKNVAFVALDAGLSLFVGVLLTLSSTLLIQSVVSRYLDLTHKCEEYNSLCEGEIGWQELLTNAQRKAALECINENPSSCMDQCYCVANNAVNLGYSLMSAGFAFLNGIVFYVLYSYQRVQVQDVREDVVSKGGIFKPFGKFADNFNENYEKYLCSGLGSWKIVALIITIFGLGFAAATRPNNLYKETIGQILDISSFWAQYVFSTVTIVAFIMVLLSLAFFTYVTSEKSAGTVMYLVYAKLDAAAFLVFGFILLAASCLYLHSTISHYYDMKEICDLCTNTIEEDNADPLMSRFSRAMEAQARNQEEDITQCSLTSLNCKEACYCSTKVVLKYYLSVVAGAFGVANYFIFVVISIFGFRRRPNVQKSLKPTTSEADLLESQETLESIESLDTIE